MARTLIYESPKSKLYKLESSEWNTPVLLKILNFEFPTPKEISQFYNEFNILETLDIPYVRKPLKKAKYDGKHCMYLQWENSQTLKEAFRGKQNDIIDFLHIAVAITKAVGELHQNKIIHKDLNPNNILVNLQERSVKLISFGIASKIDLKEQHLGNPENLEGTLAYISPEQTGRMNRVVDYRSDLYSLGVTLYEMLAGRSLFKANDALEMVHNHLAVIPISLHVINPNVPKPIADIISILLSKKAEDRYQSAFGLLQDLEDCLISFEETHSITPFELKRNDFSGKFNLPQKLYGRDEEMGILIDQFDQVTEKGISLITVAGYSGTGKSALVHEIHKPITEKRGYFIEGKFDQFQRSVPYYAFIQAINNFVNILLTEPEEKLTTIKNNIQQKVGDEGKVLTDVFPTLELIIGKQKDIPELGGAEAQNRFNYIFKIFIEELSNSDHPLVLFIDDLQWADSSSLSLIHTITTDRDNNHLLCIGAYRDNEVHATHPLMVTLAELHKLEVPIKNITIGNLPLDDINELISDAIFKSNEDCLDLAQLVHNKTQGNAFFITQFLKSLYEEQLLYFNFNKKEWEYSLEKINAKNITDNVVELIAGKAKKLPSNVQNALKLAACIGNTFNINHLSIIHEKDVLETKEDLQIALGEGLILPFGEDFKFAHDRIQQAVYSLIPEEEKSKTHYQIGHLLLEHLDEESREDNLFDIVNHLNDGRSLLTKETDLKMLCKLNLRAGKKAKESSAFKLAYDYLKTGIDLLKKDSWNTQYEDSLNLFALAGETAYLNGDFTTMNTHISAVLENARELLEKVKSYEIKILAFKAENKLLDAIHTGLDLLEQLGEKFPRKAGLHNVMVDLVRTKLKLRGKSSEYLENLPEMTNKNKIAAMRIIADIASCSYWATPNLFPLLVFRLVHLSLKFGNTAVSSFAYSTYGVILCGVLGQMKEGYKFGKLGLVILDKYHAKEWKTQVYTPMYCLIVNWNEHIDETLKPLQESYHIGLETGAIEFACINTNIYCIHAYLSGKPLERLEVETRAYSESFNTFNQETNFNYNEVYRQPMLNLMGKAKDVTVLTGTAYNEEKMFQQNNERNDRTGQFFLHFNKLILLYLFEQYEEAKEHAKEARKLLEAVLAKFEIPNHHFYEALTLIALYEKASFVQKQKYLFRINSSLRQFKKWAKDAPENFLHKYHLIKAEKMRVLGKGEKARTLYDEAIKGASAHSFIHEEAIAQELAGKFYQKENAQKLAEYYLKASYNSYREWGAKAKYEKLAQDFPQYVSNISRSEGYKKGVDMTEASSTITGGVDLDLNAVLKSSASISGEIVLENLLSTLLKIVMENAGADRGFVLLRKGNSFKIDAASNNSGKTIDILQDQAYQNQNLLSESVLSYVIHSQKSVVINDAQKNESYFKDTYIKESNTQSILCLPILSRGKLSGILYLENTLTTGAFKQDRIELLTLLSGQIAVSLDNAILYENLENKVAERTKQLEQEKEKSDKLLLNILPSETAEELKTKGITTPKKFEKVTVMFTDFKGFTQLSEKLSPEELVQELDTCFSAFDHIIEKHNLEKIKTIGDSYMCVGGLPVANSTHANDAIKAAIEINEFMNRHLEKAEKNNKPAFQIRIGLHTGPVIAGVVGAKKFVYDIWGDTVNTASRMESSGEPGRVNISETTYELIKDKYQCEYRGHIKAKNKGEIEMYFVETKTN